VEQQPQSPSHISPPIFVERSAFHENWTGPITTYDYFAAFWLKDVCEEAKKSGDDACRREIVFAVFFAETYLFEWIRDEVAQSDISILNSYFDDRIRKRGVKDKWKKITKELCTKNHIQNFNWDSRYWGPFIKLVDARDGLVHAKASRPQQAGQPQGDQPFPSRNYLNQMTPGSAV